MATGDDVSSSEEIVDLISLGGTATHGNDNPWYPDFASKATDGDIYTKWCFRKTADYPWIAWTFNDGRREVANMYSLTTADDMPHRDPKHWKIYGSMDGESWDLLDERDNMSWSYRFETKRFTMNNTVAYNSYKFEFIERCGDESTWNGYQISEWTLYYDPNYVYQPPTTLPPTT